MSEVLHRARLLRERHRHEEAIAALHQHLAMEPRDAAAHFELALNRSELPGQRKQALDDIRTAVSIEPDNPLYLAVQAQVLCQLDREQEALAVAASAIALDPSFGFAWVAKALALSGLSQWSEAENCARKALELDPEDNTASNLLSHCLRMQGKLGESSDETLRRLARDPENAFSFANAGWVALQGGQPREAEKHFREALRIDPELEHARLGLRESYKARSPLYRAFLRWVFFMQSKSQAQRWLIIIGLIVGVRFGRALLSAIHPLAAVPLVAIYFLFVFGTWLASGIGHFLLLKDPVARLSLTRREKLDGLAVGGLLATGLAAVLVGLVWLPNGFAMGGGLLAAAAMPASLVFTNRSKAGVALFGCIAVALLAGAGRLFAEAFVPGLAAEDAGASFLGLGLLAVVATTWLAAVPALQHEREE